LCVGGIQERLPVSPEGIASPGPTALLIDDGRGRNRRRYIGQRINELFSAAWPKRWSEGRRAR
jgi:hypothetical protein